jgi:exodeoxyribonuclease-5
MAERGCFGGIVMELRQRFAMLQCARQYGNPMPQPKPTEDQLVAIRGIHGLQEISLCASFHGAAGTGKTTTLQLASKKLNPQLTVFLTPTHKAGSVLREKMRNFKVLTVASFIGQKGKKHEDQTVFEKPSIVRVKELSKQWKQKRLALVIVDESSMVSQETANLIQLIVDECEAGLLFSGDPYQLPPVESTVHDEDGDEAEFIYSKNMCHQFDRNLNNFSLTKVLRHNGPVLDYATSIRNDFFNFHTFPGRGVVDEESSIHVYRHKSEWMRSFFEFCRSYGLDARAVTHTNTECRFLTKALRFDLHGDKALSCWTPGETIAFPKYTELPPAEPGVPSQVIYSQTEAVVERVDLVDLNFTFEKPLEYCTPSGQARELSVRLEGKFQCLTLRKGFMIFTAYCPLLDDEIVRKQRRTFKRKIGDLKKYKAPLDDLFWAAVREYDKYFPIIYSASVMTVHKSQGSTFKHVFVDSDVNRCTSDYRNSLLYVAATRASKSVHFDCS